MKPLASKPLAAAQALFLIMSMVGVAGAQGVAGTAVPKFQSTQKKEVVELGFGVSVWRKFNPTSGALAGVEYHINKYRRDHENFLSTITPLLAPGVSVAFKHETIENAQTSPILDMVVVRVSPAIFSGPRLIAADEQKARLSDPGKYTDFLRKLVEALHGNAQVTDVSNYIGTMDILETPWSAGEREHVASIKKYRNRDEAVANGKIFPEDDIGEHFALYYQP